MKTIEILSVSKQWLLLLCCLCFFNLSTISAYTLKIGEPLVLTVDCPAYDGWFTSTNFYCAQYVHVDNNGLGVATVYPFSYNSGTVTVSTIMRWPVSGTKYFSINIVRPTFTIDKTEVTVQPGERFVLSTTMSNVYSAKYTTVWWTTSDNSVVEKKDDAGSQSYGYQNYEFTAVSTGVATITASLGSGLEVSCKVTVKKKEPTSISLPNTGKTKVGESVTLTHRHSTNHSKNG